MVKVNIGVFFGGVSVEHEVSVLSALQTINAIDKDRYNIIPIYISKEGYWYTGEQLLDIENYKDLKKLLLECSKIIIVNDEGSKVIYKYPFALLSKKIVGNIDVAFPIMHGSNGEDGTLQGYFEMLDLPYVGCNVLASAVGMDKVITKTILQDCGLPVTKYAWFYSKDWFLDSGKVKEKIFKKISYPVIVKPVNLGSSVGVTKASNDEELAKAIDLAVMFTNKILVEEMIVNLKEINCSALGDYDDVKLSVCEEPVSAAEILSYQDKYLSNGAKGMSAAVKKLPAEISEQVTKIIQDLAKQTFINLGCSGVVRIDFLIDKENEQIYVNEVNTLPGSLSFYLWEATGIGFTELTHILIQLALKKHREKSELITTFESNLLSVGGASFGGKSKIK